MYIYIYDSHLELLSREVAQNKLASTSFELHVQRGYNRKMNADEVGDSLYQLYWKRSGLCKFYFVVLYRI